MLVGAHVSVAGGYQKALDYAEQVGCECIQIFAKSPQQWRGKPMDSDAAEKFRRARDCRGFGPVFTHAAYLISLSTADPAHREKSIEALADELMRASLLGAQAVVVHVGSDVAADANAAASRVGSAILGAFELAGECGARLLLENTAGAGRTFGSSFEELAACIDASGLGAGRLGVCFDTCHGFAFGMELDTAAGWEETLESMEGAFGLERLGLVHANDSMYARGSRRDRHAWIGKGFIKESGFAEMMRMPALADMCICIEMPGERPAKDEVNIRLLKRLRDSPEASFPVEDELSRRACLPRMS